MEIINMNIGKLDEKCPKCGSKDKTIKRDIEPKYQAHATTAAVICSECGYVFVAGEKEP
jgi:Cys-rich peptide (TIGR04165 family)